MRYGRRPRTREEKIKERYSTAIIFCIMGAVMFLMFAADMYCNRFAYLFNQNRCVLTEATITKTRVQKSSGRYRNSYTKATLRYTYDDETYSTEMLGMIGDQVGDEVMIAVRKDDPENIYRMKGFGSRWPSEIILTVLSLGIATASAIQWNKLVKHPEKTRKSR